MPTWIKSGCEDWGWLTATAGSAAVNTIVDQAGYTRVGSGTGFFSRAGVYSGSRELGVEYFQYAHFLRRGFGSNLSEGHHQLTFSRNNMLGSGQGYAFGVLDGTTEQLGLRSYSDGSLRLTRNGTDIATSAVGLIAAGPRYLTKFRWKIHGSTGVAIVIVNGVEIINFSGNTQATANAYANQWQIGHGDNAAGAMFFGDIVSYSDSASWPLPEARFERITPDAAGNYSQFTPLASTNLSQISEQQPDGDTTYNSSTSTGNKDSFGTNANLGAGKPILCVIEEDWAKKTDAGPREVRSLLRISGTDYESDSYNLTADFTRYQNFRDVDPSTGTGWLYSSINGLEKGYKDHA